MNNLAIPSVRDEVSEAEWAQRVQLAAAYRLVAHQGWDDLVFTHISARVPGPAPLFLFNAYGMLFDEITASSLVKVDLHGKIAMETAFNINPAGFTTHAAIHAVREDAQCVLHVHSINGIAVSAQAEGLRPISQHSLLVLSSLGYHAFEGGGEDEDARLLANLGSNQFLMMHNHGLLTVAESVPDAFMFMYLFESACAIQIRAQAGGGALRTLSPRAVAAAQAPASVLARRARGALAWPALLRRLDRIDSSYRT